MTAAGLVEEPAGGGRTAGEGAMDPDKPRPRPEAPGAAPERARDEIASFAALQASLPAMFETVFPDPLAERTVVVLPSLSMDPDVLAKVTGVHHYEERMLCMLLLLRWPRARIVYLTSQPMSEAVVDYFLNLLSGVPARHARRRLTLLSCHDSRLVPLTEKVLERPRLLERIREAIPDVSTAHMSCFTVSALERSLAVRLGVPIYGCDPGLRHLGTKSGSRKLFRAAGVAMPDGFEDLGDDADVTDALVVLKRRRPAMARAVVKLNDGFSGEGNAVFDLREAPKGRSLAGWIRARLPDMAFEAADMTWPAYREKIAEMGAVVEAFVEGAGKRSPSVQYRVDPFGSIDLVSTHDQVLGGRSDQTFLGCKFPADEDYRLAIQEEGLKVARALAREGALGRFGVDFVSVRQGDSWRHFAIEVNLRKGGTTHPFLMLQFLTEGACRPETGLYHSASGRPCHYYASDNLHATHYRGLTPEDLIDIAVANGLHFNAASQEGVVFHLIGALSEFGKLGLVSIAETGEKAHALYRRAVSVLDRESVRPSG